MLASGNGCTICFPDGEVGWLPHGRRGLPENRSRASPSWIVVPESVSGLWRRCLCSPKSPPTWNHAIDTILSLPRCATVPDVFFRCLLCPCWLSCPGGSHSIQGLSPSRRVPALSTGITQARISSRGARASRARPAPVQRRRTGPKTRRQRESPAPDRCPAAAGLPMWRAPRVRAGRGHWPLPH